MNRRLLLFVSTIVLVAVAYVLGWSTLFTVSSIEITGSKTQISSGIVKGQKLARVEPRAVAAQFEKLDWVSTARVTRNWINGKVSIELTERTPVAIYNNTVIDSTGKSFVLRGSPSTNLVQIQAKDLAAAIKAVFVAYGLFFSGEAILSHGAARRPLWLRRVAGPRDAGRPCGL